MLCEIKNGKKKRKLFRGLSLLQHPLITASTYTSRVYTSVFNDSRALVVYLDIGSTKTVTDKVSTCVCEREREKDSGTREKETGSEGTRKGTLQRGRNATSV